MSKLSYFSANDLRVLRKLVKRVHNLYFHDLKMEDEQADMLIESLAPDTIEKYLTYGKHLQQKSFLPKRKQTVEAVHREIITGV